MRNNSHPAYTWQKLRLIIHLSIASALLLSLYPYAPGYQIFAPDWLALIILYWLRHNEHALNYWHIFLYGIVFDLLHFNFIGAESVGLLLLSYTFLRYRTFFQFLPKLGQVVSVLVLLSFKQFCILWILGITGKFPEPAAYIIPPLISTLLWLVAEYLPLDKAQRRRRL